MRTEDIGEIFKLRIGDDARLPGSSGDARGPVENFQSHCSVNAGVICENSTLNPDGEGVAENSASSTHCIDGDAAFPGSSGDAGGSDKISKPVIQERWEGLVENPS